MNAVDMEHALAGPLGIRTGLRGDVNDADFIRANDKKYLVKALTKILPKLSKRADKLEESPFKAWIQGSIDDLDEMKDALKKAATADAKGPCLYYLWMATATALSAIHHAIKAQGQ